MIITSIYELLTSGTVPVVTAKLFLGLIVLLFLITLVRVSSRSTRHGGVLPGVPELRGVPILGALPMYLRKGIPHVIGRMIEIGGDGGIAYANVVSSVLVSVHEPALVKEVLGFPDEIASREGDTSTGMSWSPFWTLRRMIGNLSLFNYVGPETRHQRSVFIREFNSTKSNREKFPTIARLAKQHCAGLLPQKSGMVADIRLAADNFAISLWGDVLYANPSNHLDDNGKVRTLSNTIMHLAGDPWPAIWYYLQQAILGLLSPGEPTKSESLLRKDIESVIGRNMSRLMQWESGPNREMKTLRSLSVQTGGSPTGPLSKFATEFANLNLFGGHHSIGLNVVWAIIELGRHPDKMRRLLDEIDAVTPQDLDKEEDGEQVKGWTLDWTRVTNDMPYLDAVLTEVNRLYPTVHATLRVMNKDAILKGTSHHTGKNPGKREELPTTISRTEPVILRKGMIVYMSYWHLHTAKKYWGEDNKEFIPERFLPDEQGDKKRPVGPLMSFGYGPRSCVGYKFASIAAKVYLVTLLKMYKVEVQGTEHGMKLGTLLEPGNPVAVALTTR
ncbi:putative cytochrome P450 [Rhypophila decipiens]|uniref:Cytochrome P450 n=1 Tax=Rhypophila decipiens TaxID=261697 RepID=A0AAN7B2G9_9PEZI|nr:putative cytochrome P450 [Rhypophila decipiens]